MNSNSENENDIEDDMRNSDEMEQASAITSTKSPVRKKRKVTENKMKLNLLTNFKFVYS
jgi:hypothetical protein